MTSDRESSLPARLRALRVDPPDDGFSARLSARLEEEPVPLESPSSLSSRRGRRRGIFLLSVAAIFVSGGAFAFLEGNPLSWRDSSEPAATPALPPNAVANAVQGEPRGMSKPRPRAAEAQPPRAAEAVVDAPQFNPPLLPSPLDRHDMRPSHAETLGRDAQPGARDPNAANRTSMREVPTLQSPLSSPADMSRGQERHEQPRRNVPRVDADLRRQERDRPERVERPHEEGRKRPRQSIDRERPRDVDATRPGGRIQLPESQQPRESREPGRVQERERRRSQ